MPAIDDDGEPLAADAGLLGFDACLKGPNLVLDVVHAGHDCSPAGYTERPSQARPIVHALQLILNSRQRNEETC